MSDDWNFEVAVRAALIEMERGDWAEDGNGSMDFGRGIKFACDLIRQRVTEQIANPVPDADPAIFDQLESESGAVIDVEWPLAPGDG